MSASNHNYVCFDCRTAIRQPKTSPRIPLCQNCQQECYNLGYKVEIPKHDDLKAWREIQAESERRDTQLQQSLKLGRVRRKHYLEKEISRMRQKEDNPDRNRQIKKLEDELASYLKPK